YIEKLPQFADYNGSDPTIRNIIVTYTINTLVSILTALICFRFLRQLEFCVWESVAGVLALLFCTTHLHYTQNMMENNLILLLTLSGLAFQYEWLQTGRTRALLFGAAAFGFNLLIRLTTGLDLIVGGVFLLLTVWFGTSTRQEFYRKFIVYTQITSPVYLCFLLIDRLYQFYRFGTWTDTYVHYFALEHRRLDPTLAANYPWETPFHIGFLGPLISPEKSIFLFDPLLVLTIVIVALGWKRFNPQTKSYIVASLLLLVAYICLYARYTVWSGNFAWGDRYVSTAVQLAVFISVPLLIKYRAELRKPAWKIALLIGAASFVIQLASVMLWMPLEIYQADDFGHPQWVIWLRLKNIIAFAFGKMDAWGLMTDSTKYDQWDYQHITTWNFLPFVLRRIGAVPEWAVRIAFALWGANVALLATALARLRSVCLKSQSYFS